MSQKKVKMIIKIGLLSFVIVSIVVAVFNETSKQKATGNTSSVAISSNNITQKLAKTKTVRLEKNRVIAYYFHGDVRCPTCLLIEKLSHDAITKNFAKQLQAGNLEWKVINVDTPRNSHLIKDYHLYTKSLIIATLKNNKQVSWKNLEKVWEYVHDANKFYAYVQTEVAKSLMELNK